MSSKSGVSLENVMEVLKTIQQTLKAHTDMLNKLASGKKPTAVSSNETTEANNKTTTKAPTIDAMLKDVLNDPVLQFRGCVAGTHSNPSIWSFETDATFVSTHKDDKKFVTELKKKLDKDELKKLKALLANKENYGITTKVSKKKSKKEEVDSDSDSVPSKATSKAKSKPKAKAGKKINVESEEENDDDDDEDSNE